MKISTNKINLETNKIGQIASIAYEGTEILHDGKEWWKKTFPIIWPVIGPSRNFKVDGKNYVIPRHGFMSTLEWDGYTTENEITMVSTFLENDIYPFSIDISIKVKVENDTVFIETTFSNLSKKEAYFHFGYHPAFKIDSKSIINGPSALAINSNGELTSKLIKQEYLVNMAFGKEYDTIVNKNVDFNKLEYKYGNHKIEVSFDSPNVQIWKPKDAMFICIEPWWGAGDPEKNSTCDAKDKDGIIKLPSGESWKGSMAIKINKDIS